MYAKEFQPGDELLIFPNPEARKVSVYFDQILFLEMTRLNVSTGMKLYLNK